MISRTTTDAAFESIALANLQQRTGALSHFNKEWGADFLSRVGAWIRVKAGSRSLAQ